MRSSRASSLRHVPALFAFLTACGDDAESQRDPATDMDNGAMGDVTAEASLPDAPAPDTLPADAAVPDAGCLVNHFYDPVGATSRETLPDDFFTVDDPATLTGLRVNTSGAGWRAGALPTVAPIFADLDTLDGWGITGGITLRFSGAVALPESGPDTATGGTVELWALGDSPHRVAVDVEHTDDGKTLIIWPMVPLTPKTRHGLIVTTALLAEDGGCISPSPTTLSLLDGTATDDALVRIVPRHADLVAASGHGTEDVLSSTVFTTQSTTETSTTIAAAIRESDFDFDAAPTCTEREFFIDCQAAAMFSDYRTDKVIVGTEPVTTYRVPMSLWLPKDSGGPVPVIVVGHGLGGDRNNFADLAEVFCPEGFALVGIDALGHGNHPTSAGPDDPLALLSFLGIDIGTQRILGLRLRDNFRQSTYDKLQLLRLLRTHPDVNGDGQLDLDMDRLAYLGISLGGIMGPELLALDGGFQLALLPVAGARLVPIITESSSFANFRPIMEGVVGGASELRKIATLVQALMDPGDPASYAAHVLSDRFEGAGTHAPHVLQQMAIDDEIVNNGSNRILARALGLHHVPPVVQDVHLIPVAGEAPISNNLEGPDGQSVTAGLFQLDRVRETPRGRPVKAGHNNALAMEGFFQLYTFLFAWRDGQAPTIVDPYAELMTPTL